jgi:hypothetical protein
MNKEIDPATASLALSGSGSTPHWDVAILESSDGEESSLEIDGVQTYLVFQVRDMGVVREALKFLQSPPTFNPTRRRFEGGSAELTLGRFGSAAVSLCWDNEDFLRCFLIIGPKARSTLRLSLDAEDVRILTEAFRQVVEDMP